jgi:hypothetical protein
LKEKVTARSRKPRIRPLLWPRGALYPQKLALISPTSGGRSVGIVRSLTRATEFDFSLSLAKQETRLRPRHLLVCRVACISALKIEAIISSESLMNYRTM